MDWTTCEEIRKGWSEDRKYRVTDERGRVFLLRVSPASLTEAKREEFQRMEECASLGIPMSHPIRMWDDGKSVYALHEWIDGSDAETVIPLKGDDSAFRYGLDAGRALRRIHTIPAPYGLEPWDEHYLRKLDRKTERYLACGLRYENDELLLAVLRSDRDCVAGRPQTFHHGDFHIGNMMIDTEEKLRIIDFNRFDYGDPWEEFNRIVWSAQASPAFASGTIAGYFEDGEIPETFWRLMRFYIASNALGSLPWAIPFGEKEILTMRNQTSEILEWYDGMQSLVPKWFEDRRTEAKGNG